MFNFKNFKYQKNYNTNGKGIIHVYDDILTEDDRQNIYDFVSRSKYVLGSADSWEIDIQQHIYFTSSYSKNDVERSKILSCIQDSSNENLKNDLLGWHPVRAWINVSLPTEVHFIHTHTDYRVLLYYVNLRWHGDWGGETLFHSDNRKEIMYASPFVPGRIIIFDGNLSHVLRPQCIIAPVYRFTYAIFFRKQTELNTPEWED